MKWTPEKLIEFKTINQDGLQILKTLLEKGKSILIIGTAGSGKTVLTKVILNMINKPLNIAIVRGCRVEYQDLEHKTTFYDSIDEFVNKQHQHDLVIIDSHYTIDFVHLKRINIQKIILIQDKKIEPRLPYLAKDIINVVIKVTVKRRKYAPLDPITGGIVHTVDTIKIYDKYLGTYIPVYYWNEEGGQVEWDTFNRLINWKPKTTIENKQQD